MKQIIYILIAIVPLLLSPELSAQLDDTLRPYSDTRELSSAIPAVQMPSRDWAKERDRLSRQGLDAEKPYQFGYSFPTKITMDEGEWTTLDNGDRVWRMSIHSSAAHSLNIVWDEFYLPKGSALFLYNKDKTQLLGAYTHRQNNEQRKLSSWLIEDDTLIIEYNQTKTTEQKPSLHIGQVVHGVISTEEFYKDLNASGDCNHDVGCSIGAETDLIKDHLARSVGLMLVNGDSFCTSCLINNTSQDETPYMLTANHCLGPTDPANLSVRLGWISENPVCGTNDSSEDGPQFMLMSGMEVVASNSGSDFALLRLNNLVPQEWDRVYAGWDRSGQTPDFVFGIHHPAGDIMKVCREDDQVIQAINAGAETWEIQGENDGWEIGVTEPGSSGSPLFDPQGHIIGQLFGGTAACTGTEDNDEYDYYGRFDVSWDAGMDEESRLSDWLDPTQTQVEVLSAWPPLTVPDRDLSVNLSLISVPPASECGQIEEGEVELTVRNRGRESMDSILVSWTLDGQSYDSVYYWTAIDSGETITLLDSTISVIDSMLLSAQMIYINGDIDSVPGNDQDSLLFLSNSENVPITSTGELTLTIQTDSYPEETTWELGDEDGNIIDSGGPYNEENERIDEDIVISDEGCYTLNVFDSASDGLCCFFGEGYYLLVDGAGDTLASGAEFSEVSSSQIQTVSTTHDAALQVLGRPAEGEFCYDLQTIEVEVFLKNVGDSMVREILVEWRQDDMIMDTLGFAELLPGQNIPVSTVEIPASSTFQARIIGIERDENQSNNLVVYQQDDDFEGERFNSDTLVVEILTDNWPGEIVWEIENEEGLIIASEGSFQDENSLIRHEIPLDLNACFTFKIFDSACDGIFSPGEYRLLDMSGNLLSSGSEYGCSDEVNFYTEQSTSTSNQRLSSFQVYPNPASQWVKVSPENEVRKVQLFTLYGQHVLQSPSAKLDISTLSPGVYFVVIHGKDGQKSVHKLLRHEG